jgi:hypothetical protein
MEQGRAALSARAFPLALLGLFAGAHPLWAQQTDAGATLSGRVSDRSTGQALPGAQIILLSDGRAVTSDSVGRYVFNGLPVGVSQLIVRAPNVPALQIIVEITAGIELVRPIVLDSTAVGRRAAAQSLPTVAVTAPAAVLNYRLVDFERRRLNGRGQYLTEDDIIRSGAFNVADAVKGMRGVTYECSGGPSAGALGSGCFVRMSRAPMRCLPEFVVDDHVMNDFGPNTPIRDIVALELYTGPSEVPGEYAGRNAGCGVVVIWTRSGPRRIPRP